jgi:mitochondrial import receptor subunit TOM40
VGYDYILRNSRLRGRIDNTGVVSAFLEERLNAGRAYTRPLLSST